MLNFVVVVAIFAALEVNNSSVALVLEVTGNVTVVHKAEKKGVTTELRLLDRLKLNDELRVSADGTALLFWYSDGHRERLLSNAHAHVSPSGCKPTEKVVILEAADNVAKKAAKLLNDRPATIVLRSAEPSTEVVPAVTPIHTSTVLTDRPEFKWVDALTATQYEVEVWFSSGRELSEPVWKSYTHASQIAIPSSKPALQRGQEYRLVIRPMQADDSATIESTFFVMDSETAHDLSSIADRADKSNNSEELKVIAVVLEEFELFDTAIVAYERLVALYKNEAAFATPLARLYNIAGRTEDAKRIADSVRQLGHQPPLQTLPALK